MALTPRVLRMRAQQYQHLAAKVRRQADTGAVGPIAPRLIELAEKLEHDAVRDEESALILAERQRALVGDPSTG